MLAVHLTIRIEGRSEPCPFTLLQATKPDFGWHIQEHHKIEAWDQSIAPACNGPGQHPLGRECCCFCKQAHSLRRGPLYLEGWRGRKPGADMPSVAPAPIPAWMIRNRRLRRCERAPAVASLTSASPGNGGTTAAQGRTRLACHSPVLRERGQNLCRG